MPGPETVLTILAWAIPVIVAITFHEASHGYVARHFGDDTAWRLGRVTLNPLNHVDPFGTIILPAILILAKGPVFGYAKPVPVNFRNLRNPRRDMVWVAAAGPAMNLALAIGSALLIHLIPVIPAEARVWYVEMLDNSIVVNLVLAVFNMLPLPPLDGGRVAVGLLPDALAFPLARLERHGMLILIGLIFLLPFIAGQLGYHFSAFAWLLGPVVDALYSVIVEITGLGQ
jgi:Zn-dependent protease